MKKQIILSMFVVAFGVQAQANRIECRSKYFNHGTADVVLRLEATSETRIKRLELKVDNETARRGINLKGREYDGRKYKNMMAFSLEGKNMEADWGWGDARMALLVPQGFSEAEAGQKFKAIITASASDGGSYNTVLCRVAE